MPNWTQVQLEYTSNVLASQKVEIRYTYDLPEIYLLFIRGCKSISRTPRRSENPGPSIIEVTKDLCLDPAEKILAALGVFRGLFVNRLVASQAVSRYVHVLLSLT